MNLFPRRKGTHKMNRTCFCVTFQFDCGDDYKVYLFRKRDIVKNKKILWMK